MGSGTSEINRANMLAFPDRFVGIQIALYLFFVDFTTPEPDLLA
jgi:hypothetical protein